jgi:hypothetical protein
MLRCSNTEGSGPRAQDSVYCQVFLFLVPAGGHPARCAPLEPRVTRRGGRVTHSAG